MADASDSTVPPPPCPRIGRCPACNERARLDDEYCRTCLDAPKRGREWAEFTARIRKEPAVAQQVFGLLASDRSRRIFIAFFGLPAGCVDPDAPKPPALALVTPPSRRPP